MWKDEDEDLVVLQPHLRLKFRQSNNLPYTSTLSADMKVFMFKQCGKDVSPVWSRLLLCHSSHLLAARKSCFMGNTKSDSVLLQSILVCVSCVVQLRAA